jgi:hypothetical protein
MEISLKLRLKNLLWGVSAFGLSATTIAAVAFYSFINVSPTSIAAPSGVLIAEAFIFIVLTLFGAFTVGRAWRAAPEGIGVIAALPFAWLWASNQGWLGLGIVSFVFAVYCLANRWPKK